MKKIYTIVTVLLLSPYVLTAALFNDIGINVGFNTFRLIGDNPSVQPQFPYSDGKISYSGGGLSYIEPGFDISATLFMDANNRHRVLAGVEYIGMNAKEVVSIFDYAYSYAYHSVDFIDGYIGYHFSFYKAPWQNVRLYSGLEMMFNNIILNEMKEGLKAVPGMDKDSIVSERESIHFKPNTFRFGGRIRIGFEGKIKENLYIVTSGTLGIYNLLGRDDSTGELFHIPNSFDKGEAFQPFFNFLISFQYRFNDGE